MSKRKHDFAGWATRNGIKASDGRTIMQDAFKGNDGQKVPLVWNHNHNDPSSVLGHVLLENRKEGVYAYGYFNDTPNAQNAKSMIKHRDVDFLSIYANNLKQTAAKEVTHGVIREVSLVLAGANPGAYIDTIMSHSDEIGEEAIIYHDHENGLSLYHSDDPEEKKKDKKDNDQEDEEQENKKKDPESDVDNDKEDPKEDPKKDPEEDPEDDEDLKKKKDSLEHKEDPEMAKEKTVEDVFNELTEEQQNVVYAMIGVAIEEATGKKGDQEDMKHNLFDNDHYEDVLTHSEITAILDEAKKSSSGSLKDVVLQHGITNVGALFPEARPVSLVPETISEDMDWVQKIMKAVKNVPFSRIRSSAIDITGEQARAKGYVKGNKKVEEVITALKRVTTPTTVYKLQKMDRDDVIDITDFDVVAWLKAEMRLKLDEEIARAILLGDGRTALDNDKINPDFIRPVLGDDSTYTVAKIVTKENGISDNEFAKDFIRTIIKSRKEYKGSGNPTLYTTEDMLTDMLLIEDLNGRAIYDTIEKLATKLRVKEIITVAPMEDHVRTDDGEEFDFRPIGILVNLADYNVGADRGGAVELFDDFDLNYNKLEYLIETRCSGALTKPFSAITFELKSAHVAG